MANLITYKNRYEKVTIVDDCMGSGKTSWAIQYMNEALQDKKFIFITPLNSEVKRVIKEIINRTFHQPNDTNCTKLHDLKKLLRKGCNVATTHALFKKFDDEVLGLLRLHNYVLIMDEVMDVIEQVKITKDDMEILLNSKKITVDESKEVHWIADYEGRFLHIKNMCKTERLFNCIDCGNWLNRDINFPS